MPQFDEIPQSPSVTGEILSISKPDDWNQSDWDELSPTQKARYVTNPNMFRPGESGRDRAKRKGGEITSVGSKAPARSDGEEPEVGKPSFEVTDASTVQESIESNGLALINDAFARAARAAGTSDPFDRYVYGILLGKVLPMASMKDVAKSLSGAAKKRKKALEMVLSQLGGAQDASFTPVVATQGVEKGADDAF